MIQNALLLEEVVDQEVLVQTQRILWQEQCAHSVVQGVLAQSSQSLELLSSMQLVAVVDTTLCVWLLHQEEVHILMEFLWRLVEGVVCCSVKLGVMPWLTLAQEEEAAVWDGLILEQDLVGWL